MSNPEETVEINVEGLCGKCPTACCRGDLNTLIELTEGQAEILRGVGTKLKEFLAPSKSADWSDKRYFKKNAPDQRKFIWKVAKGMGSGSGLFGFLSDCGFLVKAEDGRGVCGVYDRPDLRPPACSDLRPGSGPCKDIREKAISRMALMDDSFMPDLGAIALGQADFPNI